jgi:hypothetical protein
VEESRSDDDLILPAGADDDSPPSKSAPPPFDATPYELEAESPPLPAARHPLPPPNPVGATYGLLPQGPPPLPTQSASCPMCRVAMPPAAVLCVACGFHRGLRRYVKDDPWARRPPAAGPATVPGTSSASFVPGVAPLADYTSPPAPGPYSPTPPKLGAAGLTQTVRWCASCGGEIPPGVVHCPRCNLTVSQKLGEQAPSAAAGYVAELAIPVAAVLATLALTPAAVAWAHGLGGPLLAMVVFVTLINASLGAAVVRVACWVLGEDVPDWPRAAAMCFLAGIVAGGTNLMLHYLPIRGVGGVIGALTIMFCAPGMVFYLLLDVTFWKGVLIYAVYFLILLVFFLVFGAMLGVAAVMW